MIKLKEFKRTANLPEDCCIHQGNFGDTSAHPMQDLSSPFEGFPNIVILTINSCTFAPTQTFRLTKS